MHEYVSMYACWQTYMIIYVWIMYVCVCMYVGMLESIHFYMDGCR